MQGINVSPTSVIVTFAPSLVFVVTDVVVSAITYRVHVSHVHYYNNNNCVSTLPRRTSHRTALSNAAAPNSNCSTELRQPNSESSPSLAGSRSLASVPGRVHPESNAAAVTPREPKFIKMGEDLSE